MPSRRERAPFRTPKPAAFHADLFGALFGLYEPPPPFSMVGDVAVVSIEGPLEHHENWCWDSYDAIDVRFSAALESAAETVLLRIDSPGGLVSGCFELARSMRARAKASGKRLVAYADGYMCSGAYALACAADAIYAPPTATIGSIGILQAYVDVTAQDAAWGEKWHLFSSGERKTDGNPHQVVSGEAATRAQAQVDELAQLFFGLVSDSRSLDPAVVRDLQGTTVFGAGAKAARLIDDVKTLDEVFALLAGSEAATATSQESDMSWKEAMKKAADDGDEEAKKALGALEDDDGESAEDGGDDAEAEEGGSDDDDEDDDEKKKKKDDDDKDSKSSARSTKPRGTVAQRLQRLEANDEKRRLLASRPDLPSAQRADLLGKPLSVVRYAVESLPKAKKPAAAPSAKAAPAATAPSAHVGALAPGVAHVKGTNAEMHKLVEGAPVDEEDRLIARAMGVAKLPFVGVVNQGIVQKFAPMSAAAAAARLRELERIEQEEQAASATGT